MLEVVLARLITGERLQQVQRLRSQFLLRDETGDPGTSVEEFRGRIVSSVVRASVEERPDVGGAETERPDVQHRASETLLQRSGELQR